MLHHQFRCLPDAMSLFAAAASSTRVPCCPMLQARSRRRRCQAAASYSGSSSTTTSTNTDGVSSPGNLGQLSRYAQQDSSAAVEWSPSVPVSSFESRGLYMDGPALFGSGLLLLVLLALSLERILGLDRVINKALQQWKEDRQYKRRNDVLQARQDLLRQWESDQEPPST